VEVLKVIDRLTGEGGTNMDFCQECPLGGDDGTCPVLDNPTDGLCAKTLEEYISGDIDK
jgi:hypothetical protein